MYENEKKKLIAGAYEMPSDSFEKIVNKEFRKIESEEELFFEEELNSRKKHEVINLRYSKGLAFCAMAAVLFICILNIRGLVSRVSDTSSIYVDVNPGIKLEIDNNRNVTSVEAINKDAMEIIDEIDREGDWQTVLSRVMYLFNEKQYLSEEKKEMLVTYCHAGKETISEKEVENVVNDFSNNNNMEITLIYQSISDREADYNKAKEHNVSVGKYYLLQQITDETDADIEELCSKNLHEIHSDMEEKSEKLKEKTHKIIPQCNETKNDNIENEESKEDVTPETKENKVKHKKKKKQKKQTKETEKPDSEKNKTKADTGENNTYNVISETMVPVTEQPHSNNKKENQPVNMETAKPSDKPTSKPTVKLTAKPTLKPTLTPAPNREEKTPAKPSQKPLEYPDYRNPSVPGYQEHFENKNEAGEPKEYDRYKEPVYMPGNEWYNGDNRYGHDYYDWKDDTFYGYNYSYTEEIHSIKEKKMEELYRTIEEKIKESGYRRHISGEDVYNDICDQIDGKENGSYLLLSKFEDDVMLEYNITIMDDEFNLGILTLNTPEGKFSVDFDK